MCAIQLLGVGVVYWDPCKTQTGSYVDLEQTDKAYAKSYATIRVVNIDGNATLIRNRI